MLSRDCEVSGSPRVLASAASGAGAGLLLEGDRITPAGLDVLAWRHHRTTADRPCPAWREIALQPHERLLLRRYAHLLPDLQAAPAAAGTLWEALIEAHHDHPGPRPGRCYVELVGGLLRPAARHRRLGAGGG